jgi:hypothetical protein
MVSPLFLLLAFPVMETVEVVRIDCPDRIYSRQELAIEVSGWEGWERTYPKNNQVEDPRVHSHVYFGIGFYQDHPSNHMMLRADSSEMPPTFTFGDSANVWAVCQYSGTVVTFIKSIGSGVSHCVIVNETSGYQSKNVGVCYRR